MSGNLIKKYASTTLIILCIVLIVRELVLFLPPICFNTLYLTFTNQPSQPLLPYLEGAKFTKHRLKLWYGGRCVVADPYDNNLVVSHCNPDLVQTFTLTADGTLVYDSTGTCVTVNKLKPNTLNLKDCSEGIIFKFDNSSYLRTELEGETVCLSPVAQTEIQKPDKNCCLKSPLALTACDDEASRLEFIEESFFKKDRIAFVKSSPPSSGTCRFKACGLNTPTEPVKTLESLNNSRCKRVFDCVTVITKTARRPYLVTRLAQSIRDKKGYDLRIISYDDGPNDYPEEEWQDIKKYPYLQYIVGDDEDMGISLGRNLALKMVKTKYFLLVDDDHVFNDKTNLDKMIEILDTTDATLVGGKFEGFMKFAGALKFGNYHSRQEFAMFSGSCERDLPQFPHCEQCDSTSNIFLAKTQEIIEMGGWSEELKIAEHADFFVKMKAAGNKVVYCDDIEVINQQESAKERSKSYHKLRYNTDRKNRMYRLMNSRYNVNGLFWCSEYKVVENAQPHSKSLKYNELKCLKTKHKIGYC